MAGRITRSRSRQAAQSSTVTAGRQDTIPAQLILKDPILAREIALLPQGYKANRRGLTKAEHDIMALKKRKLKDPAFQRSIQEAESAQAAAATLVFAQHEAGTAVCISPKGLLLTCAHCVHDTENGGTGVGEKRWLLFASGQIVLARCVAWESHRDLALLQIIAAKPNSAPTTGSIDDSTSPPDSLSFPSISLAISPAKLNTPLTCIGHPGSEDLEASTAGIATDYDVLHISTGSFRGLARGQDPQNNSEIGAMKHDCWTYWGHSGAPLAERVERWVDSDGRVDERFDWRLVGLHSSWDDRTGMRRGVPLEALRAFLGEWVDGLYF